MSANLDTMAGDLSKLNELFHEDPLILAFDAPYALVNQATCQIMQYIQDHTDLRKYKYCVWAKQVL